MMKSICFFQILVQCLLIFINSIDSNQLKQRSLDEVDSSLSNSNYGATNSLDSQEYLSAGNLALTDWDSTFYGKPVCVPIPQNMSLCNNMSYKKMKMPNLLGHDSIDEIEYQSSVWIPLQSISCNRDTQLFLCSLFAPVCVEQSQAVIYPCRSLCESVKRSCEGPMLAYNYPWPSMFNCSNFPEDNGLCIQPSSQMPSSQTEPSTAINKPKVQYSEDDFHSLTKESQDMANDNHNSKEPKNSNRKQHVLNLNENCFGCDNETANLQHLVTSYCKSEIVLRGRIQWIRPSRFDLFVPKSRKNFNHKNSFNKIMSMHALIPRRDRKALKGSKFISPNLISEYLSEDSLVKIKNRQMPFNQEHKNTKEMEIFFLSNYHINIGRNEDKMNRTITRSLRLKNQSSNLVNRKKDFLFKRAANSANIQNNEKYCKCERMRKSLKRNNTKYLIMANVMRIRKNFLKPTDKQKRLRKSKYNLNKRDVENEQSQLFTNSTINNSDSSDSLKFQKRKFHSKKDLDESNNNNNMNNNDNQSRLNQRYKLIYMTSIVQWHQARHFVDYLEDDSFDKTNLCKNIFETVNEIRKYQSLF